MFSHNLSLELEKNLFFNDNKDVIAHFDCRVWITVSQTYDVKEVLRDMLLKLYKQKEENPPQNIYQMDQRSLTEELRIYLKPKRYVVVFDDVWSVKFWDDIKFALIDNKSGSKIFITTRNEEVLVSCKISSFTKVLHLQPLTQEQSLTLFRAFKFDHAGCCPEELVGIANEIVQKCKGLPLAIVAIGGLLSTKEKNVFEWQRFSENLSEELKKDTHLMGIKEVLGLGYDDLPYYLKSCLLYFGMYPEDYEVKPNRVIRQWTAEGFVKEEREKTLEEVAEGYLTELIHRSLVHVSSLKIGGKVKRCRVHDQIREMILEKFEDLNFCTETREDPKGGNSSLSGKIRRLSLTSSINLTACIETSHVRSLLFVNSNKYWEDKIPKNFKLLRVVHFSSYCTVPESLGNFIHLKYLNIGSFGKLEMLKSIGMLRNLETLNIGTHKTINLPKEFRKLRKLRHLTCWKLSLIHLEDCIGEMISLQTLRNVYFLTVGQTDREGKILKGLGKMKQMRDLRLIYVGRENATILSSSINEMQHLEKLVFAACVGDEHFEVIDLDLISLPTKLQKLSLKGVLQKLPKWIPKLQNLVQLTLCYSRLTEDSWTSLKSLQNLLSLSIEDSAYAGVYLHFEDGWFQKLKQLKVLNSVELRDVIIDKGALPSLKKLLLKRLSSLKNIPTGIQHLEKLEDLKISYMSDEFEQNISTEDWNSVQHVPLVKIYSKHGYLSLIPNPRS